jgi:hypothetical protein
MKESIVMFVVPIVILFAGVMMFLLSLPLILRKVPMNHFYGIHLRASFESDERWYDINAYGGRQLAAWSWVVIATGFLGFFVPHHRFPVYAWASMPVILSAVLIPIIRIFRRTRSL